ncbi:MAG TPA: 30S ribosome-binding factor RbfA [Acidimicrobiia bacterium]|jgi:ribosome-binding factor A|nr:30S ribosome-binding factor RbfA [Acidimicrobiia bacterium]
MSDRMLRVNSTIREVLAEEIERMSDARLELVSVTAVDTAPNLRSAVVYIDVLGVEERETALEALRGAARRLQSSIGRQVRMKYVPTLEFQIDPGITGGERIEQILRDLKAEQAEEE